LRARGFDVYGPSKEAAKLEASKAFSKARMMKYGVPTAAYGEFTQAAPAKAFLNKMKAPYVLKADGLAAGKGVVIAETLAEAEAEIDEMLSGKFGDASATLVIEEFMHGEEASFFALTDGTAIIPFGSAQDHKRVGDGDTGPNTGGMGAYSPAPVLTPALQARVMAEIIEPTVRTMREEGHPYQGVLFAGLMLTADGPKLIEYNARFGDPECQVLMMRLQSDLVPVMLACAQGALAGVEVAFRDQTALTVVVAAKGYPGTPEKGGAIDLGEAEAAGVKVFHAGTALKDGALVANGGRVLNVTAMASSVTEAQQRAYQAVDAVSFPSGFCRRDIGWREVAREQAGQN
ncbi:MAG: phosphoribosylamine--glycine ligase, partial [Erythrobacteraceae bacterium]